jgi:hypothetical protein
MPISVRVVALQMKVQIHMHRGRRHRERFGNSRFTYAAMPVCRSSPARLPGKLTSRAFQGGQKIIQSRDVPMG